MPKSKSDIVLRKGLKFWWHQHGRRLLTMQVDAIKGQKIKLTWEHYKGLARDEDPLTGKVEWTFEEYAACYNKEYVEPLTEKDLKSDEELCHSCNGTYFEVERDFEIMSCIWCEGGKRKKSPPTPPINKRGPFHPEIK